MEYEIRERRYTDHLVHHVVVRRGEDIGTGWAYANRELAYDHLLDTITQPEREILDQAADMKNPHNRTIAGEDNASGKYQAYAHAFKIITGVNAYVIHGLVNAILRDRGIKTKNEGPIYTAYLNIKSNEITIINKYGEMINDFPVIGTSIDALEANGWELVNRVWQDISNENHLYGTFKTSVRRA